MYELTKEHNEQINRNFLCFPKSGKTLTLNMLLIGIHNISLFMNLDISLSRLVGNIKFSDIPKNIPKKKHSRQSS